MTRTIVFFIIGIFFLKSSKCWGLGEPDRPEWWETALIYELEPLSFKDSDNDGFGDFQGIVNQLWYFEYLEVDAICLHAIYSSDFGVYINNHTDVNWLLGSIGDFDRLVNEAHSHGIKVILDFVPYHTSDRHPWFKYSRQSIFPYTDFYIWSLTNPPNDPAWRLNFDRSAWYHFKIERYSPILNLKNLHVRDHLKRILEFWLARNVDGFRITGLPLYLDVPIRTSVDRTILEYNVEYLYEIRRIVDEWTKLNNSTSKYTAVETSEPAKQWIKYYGTKDKPGLLPLNNLLTSITRNAIGSGSATKLMIDIKSRLNAVPLNVTTNWMLSNRNGLRITSRVGYDMLDTYVMLSMLLPGQAYTYFGDEIGMDDPLIDRGTYSYKHAMQWEHSFTAGFTNNTNPGGIPVNRNNAGVNVMDQRNDPQSHLSIYKELAELRKHPVFRRGGWELKTLSNDAVLVLRSDLPGGSDIYLVVLNLSPVKRKVNLTELNWGLDELLKVKVSAHRDDIKSVRRDSLDMPPTSGIVLTSRATGKVKGGEEDRKGEDVRDSKSNKGEDSIQVRREEDVREIRKDLGEPNRPEWWETALIYELEPLSFKDSDNDGFGDFQGIIDQLWYFQYLEVNAICLHAIYSSDFGVYINNHTDVNWLLGGISDFDRLVNEAHSHGIKVILDFVPYHTSDRHPWFKYSRQSIYPYTDFYIWSLTMPPNDPAWRLNFDRSAWYHFKIERYSPTLNLKNLHVRDHLKKILEFWLARNVDGFRITGLPPYLDAPIRTSVDTTILEYNVEYLYEIRRVVDEWTKLNNSTSKYMVVETNEPAQQWVKYYGTKDKPGLVPLNNLLTSINRNATDSVSATKLMIDIESRLNAVPLNATTNWMLSNRNGPRITSRVGHDMLDTYMMLSMLLPGQAYTYFGDEIGMDDTLTDRGTYSYKHAMQWKHSSTAGFTNNSDPGGIPINRNNAGVNVMEQMNNPRSHLRIYKKFAELRKHLVFRQGRWELKTLSNDAVLVLRSDSPGGSDINLVILNLSSVKRKVNLTELNWDLNELLNVKCSSHTDDSQSVHRDSLDMPPTSGILLTSRATREGGGGEEDRKGGENGNVGEIRNDGEKGNVKESRKNSRDRDVGEDRKDSRDRYVGESRKDKEDGGVGGSRRVNENGNDKESRKDGRDGDVGEYRKDSRDRYVGESRKDKEDGGVGGSRRVSENGNDKESREDGRDRDVGEYRTDSKDRYVGESRKDKEDGGVGGSRRVSENENDKESREDGRDRDVGEDRKDSRARYVGESRKDKEDGGVGGSRRVSENGNDKESRKDGRDRDVGEDRTDSRDRYVGESRKDKEDGGVGGSRRVSENGNDKESRKDGRDRDVGEDRKASRARYVGESRKDKEDGGVGGSRRVSKNGNDKESRKDGRDRDVGEYRKDSRDRYVGESRKDKEGGGVGGSRRVSENGNDKESRKDGREGGVGESRKDKEDGGVRENRSDGENGDVAETRKGRENEDVGESRKDSRDRDVGESRKGKGDGGVRESRTDRKDGGVGGSRKNGDNTAGHGDEDARVDGKDKEDGEVIKQGRENPTGQKVVEDGRHKTGKNIMIKIKMTLKNLFWKFVRNLSAK